MEEVEISEKQEELIDIIISLISELKISEYEDVNMHFKDALEKIKSFNVEEKDTDLKHYVFFVKQLFLGDNGNLDIDSEKLIGILTKDIVEKIFDSLIESIPLNDFFDFLVQLGQIFSFIILKKGYLNKHIKEYEYKGINNYEVLFHIFSECKKYKTNKYILENYDIYFSETYSMNIINDLILANKAYIRLCISSPKFENLSEFNIDKDSKESTSDNSKDKENEINEIENFINSHLIAFICNSKFLYSKDLNNFVDLFYDFITRDGTKNFILNNKVEEYMKIYLDYISYPLEKLFNNFNEDSLKEFYQSLFQFVNLHKNEDISSVKRAITIGESNSLNEEEIGLILMLCNNHKCIEKLEKLIQEITQLKINCSDEELPIIQKKYRLLDEELLILEQIIKEKESQKSECVIANKPNYENKKDNVDDNKINLPKEPSKKISEPEKEINQIKSELKKDDYDKINSQQLLSMINSLKEELNELKTKNDIYDNQISALNKEISNLKMENSNLSQKVERLNDIHRNIYFRDVSKFYIKQFSQTYLVDGDNTFHICQNIINADFTKLKANHLKVIIIKIATHYLNGNKYAHMEYFISKNKSPKKKEVVKDIEKSYMNFMKFKEEEFLELKKN